jgi:hypothetical protein
VLICRRFQRVALDGRQGVLAPLMAELDRLRDRATAGSYYMLSYQAKRPVTYVDWPFPEIPLAHLREIRDEAYLEKLRARASGAILSPQSAGLSTELPAELISRLPAGSRETTKDDKPELYVRQDRGVFRVTKACGPDSRACNTIADLVAREMLLPRVALAARRAPNEGLSDDVENADLRKAAAGESTSVPMGLDLDLMWPAEASVSLGQVPARGLAIGDEDFKKSAGFFRLVAAVSGPIARILDGDFVYEGVRLTRVEAESSQAAQGAK